MSRPTGRPVPSWLSVSVTLTLAIAPGPGRQERRYEDRELQPLASGLAAWLDARAQDAGVEEARAALDRGLAELEGPDRRDAFLHRPADLGRVAWLARGYAAKDVKKGKVTTEVLRRGNFAGTGLEFAYRVPKDYDPRRADHPLLLLLPEVDEPPAQHIRTHWIHGPLLERAILVSPRMPADPETWAEVAVAGRPAGLSHVLTTLDHALETFAVDFERVFVVGRGRSVAVAMAVGHHAPQRFAGIVGRAGDAGEFAPENFTNLPSLFLRAGERAEAFRNALRALGNEGCRIEPEDDEAVVWTWIEGHRRTSRPETVHLVAGKPWPTRAYWLRIAPSSPEASAIAALDRPANLIRVSTHGVSRVTLYLDDLHVDLQAPVRVLVNGVEHAGVIPRDLTSTLELLRDGTSDPSCAYVAEVAFDATADTPGAEARAEPDAAFEERWSAAGNDVAALWELHRWCASNERATEDARVLGRLLRLSPDHEAARAALGQHGSAGQWFESREALERFQRSQEEGLAKSLGLVLQGTRWIHRDERARVAEGDEKDFPTGLWLSAADLRRLREGWARQDLAWIPPADAARVDEGLWLVGSDWVDLAGANRRHASLETMWRIPRREVLLHSTADRAVALRAIEHMGRAIEDLHRVFGAEPVLPLEVCLLRDEEQYDRLAFGDPDGRRQATETARMHLVESAYFAESWFARERGKTVFRGMGVTFWDPLAPNGDLYGVHAARLAVGLSYVEALDPSPRTVRKALTAGPREDYHAAYEAEKLMPAWLRVGGAVYAQRYFRDVSVGLDADPWWARKWSLDNLRQRGGLRPLAEVLAFRIEPDRRDDALRLLLEAGLLVSFVVDGGCAPVVAAHAELKRALAAGSLRRPHVEALTATIAANEAALRAYAEL